MPRLVLLALCLIAPVAAWAGAFMAPPGYGQFIAGFVFSEGTRRFDLGGQAMPTPAYRKAAASIYLEYGLTSWLTAVVAPTLSRQGGSETGVATNTVTGSDESAFGARVALAQAPGRVLALQVLVQPPLAPGSMASQLAVGGARNLAVDLRMMFGQSFVWRGMPGFVDIDPGARVRADPFPTEARLDLTAGLRPVPRLLFLLQGFGSLAPPSGPANVVARTTYLKLQGSAVYDITPRFSVQLGVFRTVAGVNIVRDTGPIGAAWVRF